MYVTANLTKVKSLVDDTAFRNLEIENIRLQEVVKSLTNDANNNLIEINELKKQVAPTQDFYYTITNSVAEWQQVAELVNSNAFKALARRMANVYEKMLVEEISSSNDIHKFWHIQGAKSVLHTLLTYGDFARKAIHEMTTVKKPEASSTVDGAEIYE